LRTSWACRFQTSLCLHWRPQRTFAIRRFFFVANFLALTFTVMVGLGIYMGFKTVNIEVKKEQLTVAAIHQLYMTCGNDWDKYEKLKELYASMTVGQSIVFVNERKKAFELSKWMRDDGHSVSLICRTQQPGYEEKIDPRSRRQPCLVSLDRRELNTICLARRRIALARLPHSRWVCCQPLISATHLHRRLS